MSDSLTPSAGAGPVLSTLIMVTTTRLGGTWHTQCSPRSVATTVR
jgi:hypothetical protein